MAQVAVCSEIHTKHWKQNEHHVEFWMLNLVVRKEITRLWKVNIVYYTNYREIRSELIMSSNGQVCSTPREEFYNWNHPQFLADKLLVHAAHDLLFLCVREFCSCKNGLLNIATDSSHMASVRLKWAVELPVLLYRPGESDCITFRRPITFLQISENCFTLYLSWIALLE